MLKIEWVVLISAALVILSLIMSIFFFSIYLRVRRRIQQTNNSKPQNKRKQKKWLRKLKKLDEAKKSSKKSMLLFLILFLVAGVSGGYAKYYQLTNMTSVDTENIVSSYYLLEQVEEQIGNLTESTEEISEVQLSSNIHTLAVRMASFSSKKGSDRASEKAQLLLNRYYARVGQLGVNLSSQQYEELVLEDSVRKSFIEDITATKKVQKKVLDFYKISEASLSGKQ
ncbi:hypothetical protein [Vagococcus salmoninarum]|uniref:hypothetical protein n=1 Tax=Vagococcus salmoninarum TaxID=2739 RepID=UPI003F9B4EA0